MNGFQRYALGCFFITATIGGIYIAATHETGIHVSTVARLQASNEDLRRKFAEAHMWAETCEEYRRNAPLSEPKPRRPASDGVAEGRALVRDMERLVVSIPCKFRQETAIARAEGQAGLEPGWLKREVLAFERPNMKPLEKLSRRNRNLLLQALVTMPRCDAL